MKTIICYKTNYQLLKNLFDENNNLLQNKLFVTEPNKFSLLQNIKKLFGAENKIMQGCYFVMVNSKSVLFFLNIDIT